MTWYDLGEPFLSHSFPSGNPEHPHGVATVLIPANGARLTINDRFAKGRPFPVQRGAPNPQHLRLGLLRVLAPAPLSASFFE